MVVDAHASAAHPQSVDQAGVVESVAERDVAASDQRESAPMLAA